ncbi:type I 3-dehydroquinate dehydratase [Canibacter sp. lx-72]|uniref:type I 3-dehydroquinate dehydratase n=1 Tax=Canibacter zhuwentaonis TaxID=2837491 RepID=UPI001BDC9E58|nr:type I 3-dehydroquinate dehydratase [Canibacter zhuwentaonis]MBT1035922.1 type I 3-dehydroquinate dehydratase [Canibacter zhuwentaonis]
MKSAVADAIRWHERAGAHENATVIVPLQARDARHARELVDFAADALRRGELFDAVEWRVDELFCDGCEFAVVLARLAEVYAAIEALNIPVVATLRTARDGGKRDFSSAEYVAVITELISLFPAAIDVELRAVSVAELVAQCRARNISAIVSYHNWQQTPADGELAALFARAAQLGADVAKVAVTPVSVADTVRLLAATRMASRELECAVIGIAMGELGRESRVMAHENGSIATFASLLKGSAPGQLTVRELAAARER